MVKSECVEAFKTAQKHADDLKEAAANHDPNLVRIASTRVFHPDPATAWAATGFARALDTWDGPGLVVVAGNLPSKDGSHSLYCAVIVKKVDAKTRAKVGLNELLRGD